MTYEIFLFAWGRWILNHDPNEENIMLSRTVSSNLGMGKGTEKFPLRFQKTLLTKLKKYDIIPIENERKD